MTSGIAHLLAVPRLRSGIGSGDLLGNRAGQFEDWGVEREKEKEKTKAKDTKEEAKEKSDPSKKGPWALPPYLIANLNIDGVNPGIDIQSLPVFK